MYNKISFRGTFLLKNPATQAATSIKKALGKGTLVYENVGSKANDVLVVTRNNKDAVIAKYIGENGIGFHYYPTLDTRSGFVAEQTKHAIDLVKRSKAKYVRTTKGMMSNIEKKGLVLQAMSEEEIYPHLAATLEKFKELKSPEYKIIRRKGHHEVVNKNNKKVVARISGQNACRKHYIQLIPENTDLPTRRFEMDKNGDTYEYGVRGIISFLKSFNAAAKYNSKKHCKN